VSPHYFRLLIPLIVNLQVYKIVTGIYDSSIPPAYTSMVIRGNVYKLLNKRHHYDLGEFSFFRLEMLTFGLVCVTLIDVDILQIFEASRFWI